MSRFNRGQEAESRDSTETNTPNQESFIKHLTARRAISMAGVFVAASTAASPALSRERPSGVLYDGAPIATASTYRDNKSVLESKFNQFVAVYQPQIQEKPYGVFVNTADNFVNNAGEDFNCDPRSSYGRVSFQRLGGRILKISVERKARVGSDHAIQLDQDNIIDYGLDCDELFSNQVSVQVWQTFRRKVKGKAVNAWRRVPGTGSAKLSPWKPDAQLDTEPFVSQPNLARVDDVNLNLPKTNTDIRGLHVAIVGKSKSLVRPFIDKTVSILGPTISKDKRVHKSHADRLGNDGVWQVTRPNNYPRTR